VTVAGYPPANHLLGDLGIEAEVTTLDSAWVRLPAHPHIAGADGGVRAGVVATLVDIVGGAVAIRSVIPDWMATADLTLQLGSPAVGPWVEARATILRRGRTTLVIEALVFNVDRDGSEVVAEGVDPGPVGWAAMTFTILPGRGDTVTVAVPDEPPVRWAFSGEGLDRPLLEALSIDVLDAAGGRLSMPAQAYAANSFGAVQGGVMALLADVAGAEALGMAQDGSVPVAVTDLQVTYLALGRVGPIESVTTVFSTGDGRPPRAAVVQLFDAGGGGRATTMVTVGVGPVSPGPSDG
jgi:uncharacterized protein (TIGR00369 family)